MREIKFRAWNGQENKFYYFSNGRYYYDSDCNRCVSERICTEFKWSNSEQCTELKDRNGKEIYEGDIAKVKTNDVQRCKELNYWTIEWVDFVTYSGFRCYGEDRRFNIKLTQSVIINNNIEIIGNIHEKEIK